MYPDCATIKTKQAFNWEYSVMNKSAFIRARIEPSLKITAEEVLENMGITPTQAITMLYKRIARDHEWPLELKVPNAKTRKALEETDKGIGLIKYKDADNLFKDLGM